MDNLLLFHFILAHQTKFSLLLFHFILARLLETASRSEFIRVGEIKLIDRDLEFLSVCCRRAE